MKQKTRNDLPPEITILMSTAVGDPFAARIATRTVLTWAFSAAAVICVLGVCTLLFFRELDINRELLARLLEQRATEQIAAAPTLNRSLSAAPDVAEEIPAGVSEEEEGATSKVLNTKITDLAIDCTKRACTAKLSLATSHPGYAKGFLAMVLETELPQIGSGNPGTTVRKRFFFYPQSDPRDDLNPNDLSKLEKNGYRFSRALQAQAVFSIPELLRPVAVNAYIFDSNHNLVLHERRPIEPEEG